MSFGRSTLPKLAPQITPLNVAIRDAVASHRLGQAASSLSSASRRGPATPDGLALRAAVAIKQGNLDSAARDLASIFRRWPAVAIRRTTALANAATLFYLAGHRRRAAALSRLIIAQAGESIRRPCSRPRHAEGNAAAPACLDELVSEQVAPMLPEMAHPRRTARAGRTFVGHANAKTELWRADAACRHGRQRQAVACCRRMVTLAQEARPPSRLLVAQAEAALACALAPRDACRREAAVRLRLALLTLRRHPQVLGADRLARLRRLHVMLQRPVPGVPSQVPPPPRHISNLKRIARR